MYTSAHILNGPLVSYTKDPLHFGKLGVASVASMFVWLVLRSTENRKAPSLSPGFCCMSNLIMTRRKTQTGALTENY